MKDKFENNRGPHHSIKQHQLKYNTIQGVVVFTFFVAVKFRMLSSKIQHYCRCMSIKCRQECYIIIADRTVTISNIRIRGHSPCLLEQSFDTIHPYTQCK